MTSGSDTTEHPQHPTAGTPRWTLFLPGLALLLSLFGEFMLDGPAPAALLVAGVPLLFLAVFAAVHHAETVAHRIGQPFGRSCSRSPSR